MQEIELKFIVENFEGIRDKLEEMGLQLEWKGREKNIYFDTSDKILKEKGEVLRLRRWAGHSVQLTYKGSQEEGSKYKSREEINIDVSNWEMTLEMLKRLGYEESLSYSKHREHWILGDVSVELDKLGEKRFVEIEGTEGDIEKISNKLNLGDAPTTTKGYLDILTDKN